MSDPRDFEGVYIPNTVDEQRFVRERRERDEQVWNGEVPDPGPVTYGDGSPVPEPPPMYEDEDIATLWIPHVGTLAAMLLDKGAPSEDERWACQDVWKPGSLTLVVGAQQSFKSWAMFDLMYHAAKGTNWLDHGLCDYDSILYVSNEKSRQAIYERLWLLFHDDVRLADKVYVRHRSDRIWFGNEHWHEMVQWVHEELPGRVLIILDTLTSLAPAGYDENNLKDVSQVLTCLRELQQESRMDILLVHHLNASGERPRGHTSLDGEVDGFVKFDRRGRDLDEVLVRFEPKDGLPSLGTYTFDSVKGLFKRSQARSLHVGNLVNIVRWYQERNSEGITVKELKERFFNGYRYDQLSQQVDFAVDELRLKREVRRNLLTNREANIITVMTDEEREEVFALRRKVADIETEVEVRAAAESRLGRNARRALKNMPAPEPTLFPEEEATGTASGS